MNEPEVAMMLTRHQAEVIRVALACLTVSSTENPSLADEAEALWKSLSHALNKTP